MRAGPNPLPDEILLELLRLWDEGMPMPAEVDPHVYRRLLAVLEADAASQPGRPANRDSRLADESIGFRVQLFLDIKLRKHPLSEARAAARRLVASQIAKMEGRAMTRADVVNVRRSHNRWLNEHPEAKAELIASQNRAK